MNKCQHGENINTFCASQCCVWKNAGGCQICMKKYHNHMGPTLFLTEIDVEKIINKYTIDHTIKPKCRQLQQVIFNYFTTIKNQITASLNSVCKNIINQMGYPYLYQHEILYTFKKLRNKQYKKLASKQFRKFYEKSLNLKITQIVKDESKIYHQQTQKTIEFIHQIEKIINQYSNILKNSKINFQHDNNLYEKFIKISKNLKDIPQKLNNQKNIINKINQFDSKQKKYQKIIVSQDQNIEIKNSKIINKKIQNNKVNQYENINDKQLQIHQKKQQLMDKMHQKQQKQGQKSTKRLFDNYRKKLLLQIPSKNYSKDRRISLKTQQQQSFDQSMNNSTGQNLRYAHAILPVQESKQKILHDDENLSLTNRIFIVPMKINQTECDSPLIKKKKNAQTFKLESIQIKTSNSSQDINNNKDNNQNQISDQQQKSLALLMHSLSLKSEKAIPYLQSALEYSANNLSAAEYLSFLYLEIGQPKNCLLVCNKILERVDNERINAEQALKISNNKAVALSMLGRYSQSIGVLQKSLQIKESQKMYKNLADAYQSIGINEKAIYNYQKAVNICNNYDQAYYNMAVCLYLQGNLHNAEYIIDKALQFAPINPEYNLLHSHIVGRISNNS